MIVENRPGASGTIGADQVAKASADGYTLLLSPQTSTAIAANMNRQLPYDVINDSPRRCRCKLRVWSIDLDLGCLYQFG
ncbi:MAG: tripartite tricarboxylate transporter substrate-binding protein [Pigmentiphaga sp.]